MSDRIQLRNCSIKCPAIRKRGGECWYCRAKERFVAPVEHRNNYGWDVVSEGKIVKNGYNDVCIIQSLFEKKDSEDAE